MTDWPELVDGLPNLCGQEDRLQEATGGREPVFANAPGPDWGRVQSGFALALHMHQPLVPAGGDDLSSAELIGHLQYMMEHQDVHDNHNAPVFQWCYKRMSEFVPQLVEEGAHPRILLDYSGTLLYGLRRMGADDVLDGLRRITCEAPFRDCVEWLGTAWGHPVAPSTPAQDFRLHVLAWQHHFAGLFGLEALSRVRGFSPSEMAIPNHPDVAYEFVKTLRDAGYQWVLVQEHTVEQAGGGGVERPHLPHRLLAQNSRGETASIIAIVKTQGSDTKLVAQMQPLYEAKGLEPMDLAGVRVPPLVTQIGDGENGGVMMNEFPEGYLQGMREASASETPALNVTEYLEHLFAQGLEEKQLPAVVPVMQNRIWERFETGAGPEALAETIKALQQEDDQFHMEGGSWTMDRSWVEGYQDVLGPIDEVSALFAEQVLAKDIPTDDARYRKALFHLLVTETSCYRYWGEGIWTDYAKELCRRTRAILEGEFG